MRDQYRSAVYRFEGSIFPKGASFKTKNEIVMYLDELNRHYGNGKNLPNVYICEFNGKYSWYDESENTIYLRPSHLNQHIIIHEFVHFLTNQFFGKNALVHGRIFVGLLVHILTEELFIVDFEKERKHIDSLLTNIAKLPYSKDLLYNGLSEIKQVTT